MSSDPEKFGVVADGIYDVNYDVKGKSGSLKSNWALNKRGKVPARGGFNPNNTEFDKYVVENHDSEGYFESFTIYEEPRELGVLLVLRF